MLENLRLIAGDCALRYLVTLLESKRMPSSHAVGCRLLAIAELLQSNQQDPYDLYRSALAYLMKGDKAQAKEFCKKSAHFNSLPQMNYAFVRSKAEQMLARM